MKKSGVLIVGEQSLPRAFVRAWVDAQEGLLVLAEANGAGQTMAMVSKWKPRLVLMDLETLQSVNLDVLTKLQIKHPLVKVLIYFAYAHDNVAIKVIRAGAAGFVVKSAQASELANAIRTVLAGGIYLSPEFLRFVGTVEGLTGIDGKPLSLRQVEILKLIALGLTTKAIAFELKISGKTVDVHKQALAKRLGLKRSNELFKYSLAAGLVAV